MESDTQSKYSMFIEVIDGYLEITLERIIGRIFPRFIFKWNFSIQFVSLFLVGGNTLLDS